MGEPAGNLGIPRRYLQALERGRRGRTQGVSCSRCSLRGEEFPNLLTPLGKKRETGCGPGGGWSGTGQKGHVPADV